MEADIGIRQRQQNGLMSRTILMLKINFYFQEIYDLCRLPQDVDAVGRIRQLSEQLAAGHSTFIS